MINFKMLVIIGDWRKKNITNLPVMARNLAVVEDMSFFNVLNTPSDPMSDVYLFYWIYALIGRTYFHPQIRLPDKGRGNKGLVL